MATLRLVLVVAAVFTPAATQYVAHQIAQSPPMARSRSQPSVAPAPLPGPGRRFTVHPVRADDGAACCDAPQHD